MSKQLAGAVSGQINMLLANFWMSSRLDDPIKTLEGRAICTDKENHKLGRFLH